VIHKENIELRMISNNPRGMDIFGYIAMRGKKRKKKICSSEP
jgi:hypothetical protein